MSSAHPILDTPVARALEEALASVAIEPIRDAVITRALREARRVSIPERGPEVLEFAEGPLRSALASRLGEDVAAEVLEQLRPVLERAGRRPSLQAPRAGEALPIPTFVPLRASAPPVAAAAPEDLDSFEHDGESGVYVSARPLTDPAPRGPLPIVFFASQDASASASLAQALGGRATVRMVGGLFELLDALEEDPDARRIVVLDGGYPSVQVPSLITVAPELAGAAEVVVWRAFDGDREAIASAPSEVTEAWIRCPHRDVERLADLCAAALT